jgi:hypothetical protein
MINNNDDSGSNTSGNRTFQSRCQQQRGGAGLPVGHAQRRLGIFPNQRSGARTARAEP